MTKTVGQEIIFEFYQVGTFMKVTAMDTTTLIEVSITCPTDTTQAEMQRLAKQKLHYILKKKGLMT